MRSYLLKFSLAVLAAITLHFAIILYLHAPIKAEYWVRPLIIVKRELAAQIRQPKIIFLGGSSTLFDTDASRISKELKRPAFNFGLHAGLRLERILFEAKAAAKPGDLVVLPLEQPYYDCGQEQWTDWQLDNALAWDRAYFDSLPILKRTRIIMDSGSPTLSMDITGAWLQAKVEPSKVENRLEALLPSKEIIHLYKRNKLRTTGFAYSAYNVDAFGTLQNNVGAHFFGPAIATDRPAAICPDIKKILRTFVGNMHNRHVAVAFAYPPYLVDGKEPDNWENADAQFRRDIADIGSTVVGTRPEAFYPRDMFFNTDLHLNIKGREIFTQDMIESLRSHPALLAFPHH